eukprot:COSAG02_NODE_27942_length_599_cov_1.558000_1_plen_23_part_10
MGGSRDDQKMIEAMERIVGLDPA